MYYIGIDGGGTKTAFGLFDEQGKCLKEIEMPTCHFLQVGFDGCAQCLGNGVQTLVDEFQLKRDQVKIGIGIAGYGSDENIRHQLEECIESSLVGYEYVLTNDMHIALIGALNGRDGIAVVAGTGAIAMAQAHGQLMRCGGWGYQLGDEGSAYWIGKQLLKCFCEEADGRQERDNIYSSIMNYYGMENPYQVISVMNNFENQRTEVAKLSKLCAELSVDNVKCQDIFKEAGEHIALLVKGLKTNFDDEPLVTYYGGVFHNSLFKESFFNALSGYHIIEPQNNALTGAYQFIRKQESM